MKKVTFLLLGALFGAALTLSANPPDQGWFTSYREARAAARAKNLPLFLLFTGSDWCPWCMKLHQETLDTAKFRDSVKDRFVLVYLDFPEKSKLPAALEWQNRKLQERYKVEGFPTVIIADPDGQVLASLEYAPPDEFLARLRKISDAWRTLAVKAAAVPAAGPVARKPLADK